MQINITDDIIDEIKIPKSEVETEIKKELAISLYERRAISMGIARKLSNMTKKEFIAELGKRRIYRHYSIEELKEDLNYAYR